MENNYNQVIENWRIKTKDCHFEGFMPTLHCVEQCIDDMANIVGAKPEEVC